MDIDGTINEVLARPYLIQDLHLTVPGTILPLHWTLENNNTFNTTIELPSAILNDSNKISKIEYFRYFTADMKIRIETNAQPYMSGKFWIFYDPYPTLVAEGKDLNNLSLTSISSYPGIEYDLNQMSHAEINIPFISYERAFDIEKMQDYCRLYVSQITPIRDVTTETKLRMRIYGHFENVKVFGPTSNSNLPATYINNKIKEYQRKIKAQIQVNTRQESGTKGPISQIASGVSQVTNVLKSVPVVGEVASAVGWVSDIVGNVASIFGFSKPTDLSPPCKILNVPGHGYTYVENKDESVVLSTRPDNELGPQDNIFQTNIDEMDVNYICANPGVIDVVSYTATSDNTEWLANYPCTIRPNNLFSSTIGAVSATTASPTCAEYISQLFQYWRGTICFKISLAKTPFHNGRLVLSFDPSNSISDTPLTRIGKAYTTILDLSENSSTIVKIPFLSKYDYLKTFNPTSFGIEDLTSFGTFSIGALAPLLGPDTVASTVDVVVWKWFEDVELGMPCSYTKALVTPLTTSNSIKAQIQINIMNRDQENIIYFNNPEIDQGLRHSKENMGERVVNMRPMLRSCRHTYNVSDGSKVTPFRAVKINTFTAANVYDNSNYVFYLSRIYRFFRGGFSLKFVSLNGTYFKSHLHTYTHSDSPNVEENAPTHLTFPPLNPFHEIRVPFYSMTYRRVINDEFANRTSLDYAFPTVRIETDATSSDVYTAGDDSLSYGWLVGPPVIIYTSDLF